MAFAVLFKERASREIDEARAWLLKHQGPARVAQLDDDLARSLHLLEAFPEMAALVPGSKTVRRTLLERCRYHVYYRVFREAEQIMVICFWHKARRSPRL
ncbi:MAG: type II toxin-antitoxin system RelE/ParE family toxin [Byssovorax sp.]